MTDIARYRDSERSDYILQNWMRNRGTIEFIGLWEQFNNPLFNSIEFDGIKNMSGANSFSLTPKRWIDATNAIGIVSKTGRYGGAFAHRDIRDAATLEQLVVLSNMESINAMLLHQQIPQAERLIQLNKMAITQMKSLLQNSQLKKLAKTKNKMRNPGDIIIIKRSRAAIIVSDYPDRILRALIYNCNTESSG